MKKFLLSLAAVCSFGFMANAEEIELNANDATEIDGTYTAEVMGEDGKVKSGAKYQPLLSLELGGFAFTFERGKTTDKNGNEIDAVEPAYYYATSTNKNQQHSIRLYAGNTVTIAAPAGTKIAKVVSGTTTLYEGEGQESVSYNKTATGTLKMEKLTITTGEGGVVTPPATVTVSKVAQMSEGKFAIYFPQGVATLINTSNSFGYSMLEAVTVTDGKFEVEEKNLLEFAAVEGGYTICDSQNRYWGMDATHFGAMNLFTNVADGNCVWSVEFVGEDVKISNVARTGAYIAYKQYNNDHELVTTDKADQVLPMLFKKDSGSAIETVEAADADAPVEFFNLQGVRVANPENGLFIRRQGNKVEKVVIR